MEKPKQHFGVSFTHWASACVIMNGGISQETILDLLNVELPVWHKAFEKWNEALANDQELAKKYSEILSNPYKGKFETLKSNTTQKMLKYVSTIEKYYEIHWHTEVIQNYGIDFLTVIEKHHQIDWPIWSEAINYYLDYEINIFKNGSETEKQELQNSIVESEQKWKMHWQDYYKKQNLNLASDINF